MKERHALFSSSAAKDAEDDSFPKERRIAPRFSLQLDIQWRVKSDPQGQWKTGDLIDLSIAGAAFATDQSLKDGCEVSLRIPHPREVSGESDDPASRPLSVPGRVVNSRGMNDGRNRYGVKFDRVFFVLADYVSKGAPEA